MRLVASGAGAAGMACLDLLVTLGMKREHIVSAIAKGVVYAGRESDMDDAQGQYAVDTEARTLGEVIAGADVFLGVSAPGVLKPEMVKAMADQPIILALANPVPEIMPDEAARREGCADRDRPLGLPQPGQQRPVFPYIFPRRAGCGRHGHQR
jgi:malate dehydrogenase (oxaloacetate-decarboxylating)(NADP+)